MPDSLKIAGMEIHRAPKHHIQIGGLIFSMAKKVPFKPKKGCYGRQA